MACDLCGQKNCGAKGGGQPLGPPMPGSGTVVVIIMIIEYRVY